MGADTTLRAHLAMLPVPAFEDPALIGARGDTARIVKALLRTPPRQLLAPAVTHLG